MRIFTSINSNFTFLFLLLTFELTFSNRTSWQRQQNRLTELLEARKAEGLPVYDLTVTNPTECGFVYPDITNELANPASLTYQPETKGLLSARQAVAKYYSSNNIIVHTEHIFLTASTSEAYSSIFKLLCNAGDTVLVPQPSYPLFEYLAQVNDVQLEYYHVVYESGWHIDIESIRQAITPTTKAIILIHPHNPSGMYVKQYEFDAVKEIALKHNLAFIVDEVFREYAFHPAQEMISSATESEVLTFTLNGISKMLGLPQMKLGWIIVSGTPPDVHEAVERLEILCDTFLSVNTPVQIALPTLFDDGLSIREQIQVRICSNYNFLKSAVHRYSKLSVLLSEGGWYGIIRVPAIKTDEDWACEILTKTGILVQPGYFFDFESEGYLLVSLLVREDMFRLCVEQLFEYVELHSL